MTVTCITSKPAPIPNDKAKAPSKCRGRRQWPGSSAGWWARAKARKDPPVTASLRLKPGWCITNKTFTTSYENINLKILRGLVAGTVNSTRHKLWCLSHSICFAPHARCPNKISTWSTFHRMCKFVRSCFVHFAWAIWMLLRYSKKTPEIVHQDAPSQSLQLFYQLDSALMLKPLDSRDSSSIHNQVSDGRAISFRSATLSKGLSAMPTTVAVNPQLPVFHGQTIGIVPTSPGGFGSNSLNQKKRLIFVDFITFYIISYLKYDQPLGHHGALTWPRRSWWLDQTTRCPPGWTCRHDLSSASVTWLVVYLPLWKIWAGMIIPNIWKNDIHVPNHQPVTYARGVQGWYSPKWQDEGSPGTWESACCCWNDLRPVVWPKRPSRSTKKNWPWRLTMIYGNYGILWYIVVYYGILWYIMVYYGILWYIMVYCGILWYIMVYYGILWYIVVYYGILWYIMVYYGILWYILVYSGILWYIMVYYGILWYIMVYYGILWYIMVYYGILESRRRRTKGSVVGEEWCQNAAPLRWYTKNVFAQSKMILSRAWLHDTVSCAAWNDAQKGVYLKPLFKTPCSNCYWGWSKPIMLNYRDISLMESVPLLWRTVTASPAGIEPMTIFGGGGPL